MKPNVYLVVFGVVGVFVFLALFSTLFFNSNISSSSLNVSNLTNYGQAPQFQGIAHWINSQPLNLSALKGKVVLVDFWTYSCINCIRTIPYLNAWENKYSSNGLVIVGVHSPEFAFETNYTNVLNAVRQFGISYPVAMDNNHSTWNAYSNRYWPADYLIDANGNVRAFEFGEGNYATTEKEIQQLLKSAGYTPASGIVNLTSSANFSQIGTPEIYFGYNEARQPLGNSQGFSQGEVVNYSISDLNLANTAYLSGFWFDAPDSVLAVNDSRIFLTYSAKNVNIVASGNATISIRLDGHNLNQSSLGSDDQFINRTAVANITSSRLYNVISSPSYGQHTLEIDASPGFRIYTFTFG